MWSYTQESLDEVTIKDTLEGDNMYTCSHCGKKVRAEKRYAFSNDFYCFHHRCGTQTKGKLRLNFYGNYMIRVKSAAWSSVSWSNFSSSCSMNHHLF